MAFQRYALKTCLITYGVILVPWAFFSLGLTLDKADEFYDFQRGGYVWNWILAFTFLVPFYLATPFIIILLIAYFLKPSTNKDIIHG